MENTNKAYITDVLANQLMDNYACAYLSVFDCVSQDENGIICSEEDATKAMEFARESFVKFTADLSEMCEKDIEVVKVTEDTEEAEGTVVEE